MRYTGLEIDGQMYRPAIGKCSDCDLKELCQIHILSRICSPMLKANYIWKMWDLMKIPAEVLLKLSQDENALLKEQLTEYTEELLLLRKQLADMEDQSEEDIEREAKIQSRARLKMDQRFITMENELKHLREANGKLKKELYSARKNLNEASIRLLKYKLSE